MKKIQKMQQFPPGIHIHTDKEVSTQLLVGIVLLPIVFAWFTLKQGYSNKARILSFLWLVINIIPSYYMFLLAIIALAEIAINILDLLP